MKVGDYLKEIEFAKDFRLKDGTTVYDALLNVDSMWSAAACTGYCLDAMLKAGLDGDSIIEVLIMLDNCYNEISVESAEKIFIAENATNSFALGK